VVDPKEFSSCKISCCCLSLVYIIDPNFLGGSTVAPPLGSWDGVVSDPQESCLSPCYHDKFFHSKSNHMSISRGPKNWGMLGPHLIGWGLADPRNVLFPHVCYCAKFGHSGSNSMSIHSEICQKNGPLASHLSRSLKLFGTDTD